MKKTISILLLLCMFISVFSCLSVGAEEGNTLIKPTENWYDGDADVLYIDSKEDLMAFAEILASSWIVRPFKDKTVKLTKDIDLNPNWTASATAPPNVWPAAKIGFNDGTFDGCGYTIRGIYQKPDTYSYYGLLGGVSEAATTVKNLRIENSASICASADGHGFLFGYITNNSDVTIENVYLDETVRVINTATGTGAGYYGIGGIVGAFSFKSSEKVKSLTMKNCVFAGSIEIAQNAVSYVGGLIGRYNSANTECPSALFENCASYCSFKGDAATKHTIVGGLMAYQSSGRSTVIFKNCISDIKSELGTGNSFAYGAICGATRNNGAKVAFENIYFTGYNALGAVYSQSDSAPDTSKVGEANGNYDNSGKTQVIENAPTGFAKYGDTILPQTLVDLMSEKTSVYGVQPGEMSAKNTKFNLRVLGVIKADFDELDGIDKVGFTVRVNYRENGKIAKKVLENYDITTVYTSVLEATDDEKIAHTSAELGGYIFVLPCKNLPLYSGAMDIEVTSYYTVDGNTVYGKTKLFTHETDIVPEVTSDATALRSNFSCNTNGDKQTAYEGGTFADYIAYSQKLAEYGYTKYAENTDNGDNLFATYRRGNSVVRLSWFNETKRFQVIVSDYEYLPDTEKPDLSSAKIPTVTQLARTGIADTLGMLYIIQATDGSFIIVDGGYYDNDENIAALKQFLIDNKPDTHEKPRVTWMFTHPHSDHIGLALTFLEIEHEAIELEKVCYNFPNANALVWTDYDKENRDYARKAYTRLDIVLNNYYPDAVEYVFQTGDRMYFSGGEIEFLFTPSELLEKDLIDRSTNDKDKYNTYNELNCIWRFTFNTDDDNVSNDYSFLVTGDSDLSSSALIAKMYGDYLQSEVFQVNHHGQKGGTAELFELIEPTYVFWPNTEENCTKVPTPADEEQAETEGGVDGPAKKYPIHWSGRNNKILFDDTNIKGHFHAEQTAIINMSTLTVQNGISFWPLLT
ncbi:MAG: hypothetical protein IJZ83_03545 [Clostridia bacterium]|nr:hypothetical protein [Clostridia bacterium]